MLVRRVVHVVHFVVHRVRHEGAVPSGYVLSVLAFHALHGGALGGMRLFVVVAERDDELRDARVGLDLDVDAIDERGALAPGGGILEVELLADLEKAELAERGDARAVGVLHASAHRRGEPVDVEPDLAALRRVDGHAVLDHADDALKRHGARGVEVGEPDSELPAVAHVVLPQDLTRGDDDHALARVEATRDGLTDLGQVRRAEMHPLFREVDGLRLERGAERAANLDHSIERDP